MLDSWHKLAQPRKEVREGRSFNPDEFAIALEQIVFNPKQAPVDYREPAKFFARTYFTRALAEHTGTVLKRLSGQSANVPPVLSFITQFGGGKTHTLTTLYHLAKSGPKSAGFDGMTDVLAQAGLSSVPAAKIGVFVGNAWDPREGSETPWIDLARQIAGDAGVAALGSAAQKTAPGTESLGRLFEVANGPVLLLLDEVLNFVNRHREMSESFYSFVQNLTVAATGAQRVAAVLSLPKSKTEMTDFELDWQARITRVVRRVAKDLIANDEAEVSEVVRRRLFESLGDEKLRRKVTKAYADWCFERKERLPAEWTAGDSGSTEARGREALRLRFEACYPFHPATLSVFQRKWQTLAQYQQTRGTLAMLAQWLSKIWVQHHQEARSEPLITLGSAPLDDRDFRAVVLGQLGESRLGAAIEADIAGTHGHARALDADTKGPLRGIHARVGAAVLFESSGGQTDKVGHLPELRFALGGPDVETTSIDTAATELENKAFFIRRAGTDGYRIGPKAKLTKVMADRRASLDDETDIKPAMRKMVREQFEKGATLPVIAFPDDGASVQDSPRLSLALMDPLKEWERGGDIQQKIEEWTLRRGASPRDYPASLIWCLRKPGRDLWDRVEVWLAWRRVAQDLQEGLLGDEGDPDERREVQARVRDALEACVDEVWGGYRFVVVLEREKGKPPSIKEIDLGAGHASAAETLTGRIVAALKSHGLLDNAIGAGYLDRHWPPALLETGAWPLKGLRQSFLDGSFTRLLDPDRVLRAKIVEFVERGDFGLASGEQAGGGYERIWFSELVMPEEVVFEPGVFLLKKATATAIKSGKGRNNGAKANGGEVVSPPKPVTDPEPAPPAGGGAAAPEGTSAVVVTGQVPPEHWNRLGTRLIPKLRTGAANGGEVSLSVEFVATVSSGMSPAVAADVKQVLTDLGLDKSFKVEIKGK